MFETKATAVPITKVMIKEAYRKVKANKGSAGVDEESLEEFQADLLVKVDKFHSIRINKVLLTLNLHDSGNESLR